MNDLLERPDEAGDLDEDPNLNPLCLMQAEMSRRPVAPGHANFLGLAACQLELDAVVFEIDLDTKAERQGLIKNPELFVVNKMRDCEVRYEKLTARDQRLFDEGKSREFAQFLAAEAIKVCANRALQAEAWSQQRVLKARWVLTWRETPEDDRQAALIKRREEGEHTTITDDGKKKAKARLVIIGFQHPDFGHEQVEDGGAGTVEGGTLRDAAVGSGTGLDSDDRRRNKCVPAIRRD